MILEEATTNVNLTHCTTSAALSASMETVASNVNVTTCFEEDEEEGIFDLTFDSSFE